MPASVEICILFILTGKPLMKMTLLQRQVYVLTTMFPGWPLTPLDPAWILYRRDFIRIYTSTTDEDSITNNYPCKYYSTGVSINVLIWVRIFCFVHYVLSLLGLSLLWFWNWCCLLPVAEILASRWWQRGNTLWKMRLSIKL